MNAQTETKPELRRIDRFPLYLFSETGDVISLVRRKPRKLSPIKMGSYTGVTILNEYGSLEKQYVHRLICEAFHGTPREGQQCRHLDGDKTNACAANLAWGSPSDNNRDKDRHNTSPKGERNPMAKLTADLVAEMKQMRAATGAPFQKIATDFGVTAMTAYRAVTGQSWRG
jgi:hypothetical protein